MPDLRPKNLNLFTIRFPLPAIVSILHRITGFCLFLLIPFVLWLLDYSLTETGFESLQSWTDYFLVRFCLWVLLIPFCFHLVAGVRHLLSDLHMGDGLAMGRLTAKITFVVSAVLVIMVGIWLW